MPRPPRADEAGGLYHALNRGNLRADIFRKEGDFVAFEKILHEGLQRYHCRTRSPPEVAGVSRPSPSDAGIAK